VFHNIREKNCWLSFVLTVFMLFTMLTGSIPAVQAEDTTTVAVTGVSLDKVTETITVGGTSQLTATVDPADASNQSVTWASDQETVATVNSSGLITAVSEGTANITVSTVDGSYTAACAVTVNAATVAVTGVSLDKVTETITVGGTRQLTATVDPADASNQSVTWASDQETVATVNSSGLITAVAAGTATITVSTVDGSYTAACIVTVPLTAPELTADITNNTVGQAIDITFTDDEAWRAAITGITVDETALDPAAGQYTVNSGNINIAAGVFTTAGEYVIKITASNYPDANVNQTIITLLTPPILAADTTDNIVGQAIDITFTDDEAWRNAISGIAVNGTALDGSRYTVSSGNINIAAAAFTSTSNEVVISANGYADDAVTQLYSAYDRYDLPHGYIMTLAGNGTTTYSGDGVFATSTGMRPGYMALDSENNIFISDYNNNRIFKVDTNGIVTTVVGTGTRAYSGDGGLAINADISKPRGIKIDALGNLYFSDTGNQRIRKVDTDGIITTVAGNGTAGFSGDGGLALSAQIYSPFGLDIDNAGNLYFADYINNRIRKVDTNGIITTVAGNGTDGYTGDGGLATDAGLKYPRAIAVDNAGNIFEIECHYDCLRKIDTSGIITTVVTGLNMPTDVTFDKTGNIYIADEWNYRVKKVDTSGVITTVAGIGTKGSSGDGGPALSAQTYPVNVACDSAGNLYISEAVDYRLRFVRLIQPAATPVATPASGTMDGSTTITLTSATENASIYYTTDGSEPTISSTLYTGPITINSATVIKAIAVAPSYSQSQVMTETYMMSVTLDPPSLAADSTDNYIYEPIDLTFADDAAWRAKITGITLDGAELTSSQYTIGEGYITFPAGLIATVGDHTIVVAALGYNDNQIVQNIALSERPSPVLTADTTKNYYNQPIDITFTDDPAWREAITGIKVNGFQYGSYVYSITEGQIRFGSEILSEVGDYNIVVSAFGYADTSVVQTIAPLQTPPALTADITDNYANQPIDITFTPDQDYQSSITYVTVNGWSISSSLYTISDGNIRINPGTISAGTSTIGVIAIGYNNNSVTQTIYNLVPPDLTADSSGNYLGSSIDITFTDDAAWRAAITAISVKGTALATDKYEVSEGIINIADSVFTYAGSHNIVVSATGYSNASVVQDIVALPSIAGFTGTSTVTEWDVNGDGLTITVGLNNGYSFADNVADYKDAIIEGIQFNGIAFDKSTLTYHPVSWDTHITGTGLGSLVSCVNNYGSSGYWPILDATNNISVYDRYVGLNPPGLRSIATVTEELKAAYPGVKQGIINALKAGATVSVNSSGQLVIKCTKDAANGYFSTFTNALPVCNGGIQIVSGDILLSASLPAGVVNNINEPVSIGNYFTIQEIKMHPEVWEYVDESRKDEAGVFSFDTRIYGEDRNTQSSYPYDKTYYVKQVAGNVLTEADIRRGGTMGPNGTGNKLIKIAIDNRVGPTQWASAKNMSTFITNMFRTSKDATGYSGQSSTTYTPVDDTQWLKVEDQITNGGLNPAAPYNICTNKYVINYCGDSRGDTANPAKMWIFYELPKTEDFDIASDMPVYCNIIAGFFGGSGQSTPTNGQPVLGMDGRYNFAITAVEATDLTAYDEALAAVTEADYTADSWIAYQTVVAANIVTTDNTQAEVDAATTAIIAAQASLVKGDGTIDECFIATAAYGSKFEPSVALLRAFRDKFLLSNTLGQAFVKFYYRNSPPIAAYIAHNEFLKAGVRVLLTPVVGVVYLTFHPQLLYPLLGGLILLILAGYCLKRRKINAQV